LKRCVLFITFLCNKLLGFAKALQSLVGEGTAATGKFLDLTSRLLGVIRSRTGFFGKLLLPTEKLFAIIGRWLIASERIINPASVYREKDEYDSYDALDINLRIFQYLRPYFWQAVIVTFITIPIGALDGTIAYSLKPYIDAVQGVGKAVRHVAYVPFLIVGFTVLQGALNYISIYLNGWLGFKVMSDLRLDLFKKLQTLDVAYFDKTTTGSVLQRFFRDPESFQANVLNNIKQLLTRLSSSLGLMAVLISTSWQLSIIAITVSLLILFPATQIRKVIKALTRETIGLSGDMMGFYTETVGGIRVIYGYNLPDFRIQQFDTFQKTLFKTYIRGIKVQGWLTPSMHIIASIGIALIIWQGTMMVVHKQLTTGAFVSFITALLMLYNPLKNLGGSIVSAQSALFAAGRMFQTLDEIGKITDKPNALELAPLKHEIAFKKVTFAYVKEQPVLHHISLTIPKGKTIALVGASGGGKSTIASLIPRFYDIQEGQILFDGVDIRDVTQYSLRSQIAIVNQDNFLFNTSIRDNLRMGKTDATHAEMVEALKHAYLYDFVEQLPNKMSTMIGERGITLSGGQRQRLAIARAFLKDAPVVILDEATSALDNQSEAIVQKAMDALMQERTVIVIAHRLSTIHHADCIFVIDQGTVVESGQHEELLALDKVYANLYYTQFKVENRIKTVQNVVVLPTA
jgi:subfamily B ATP-binding cassette protein MsbA